MAVLMMAHNNNNNEAKPIYHDFLGISYHSDAPVVVGKNVSFGGEIRLAEASASASVSVGASSGGLGPVSATSDLGSGEYPFPFLLYFLVGCLGLVELVSFWYSSSPISFIWLSFWVSFYCCGVVLVRSLVGLVAFWILSLYMSMHKWVSLFF